MKHTVKRQTLPRNFRGRWVGRLKCLKKMVVPIYFMCCTFTLVSCSAVLSPPYQQNIQDSSMEHSNNAELNKQIAQTHYFADYANNDIQISENIGPDTTLTGTNMPDIGMDTAAEDFGKLIDDSGIGEHVSLIVLAPEEGKTLFRFNDDFPVKIASTVKVPMALYCYDMAAEEISGLRATFDLSGGLRLRRWKWQSTIWY